MSTRFFEHQSAARKRTSWLIIAFVLAMVGMATAAFATAVLVGRWVTSRTQASATPVPLSDPVLISPELGEQDLQLGSIAAALTSAIVLFGSAYKVTVLRRGGGVSVAESVGGSRVFPDTEQLAERRLLNVVEEMAIAAGTPVPPVFLLKEEGINAFAAGYSPSDAVIGVTRGAVENLSREQLQGVIAHEFSHILNGDMRLNIRMIGVLHGILLLALVGRMLLSFLFHTGGAVRRSSRRDKDGGFFVVALLLAVALLAIGLLGSLIGGLIKAAISRQREYLADASAVQYTRNPNGIAGALKTIGGWVARGRLKHPNASEASHLYFAHGVFEGFTGLLATHPPLPKRILAIEPAWDGSYAAPLQRQASQPSSSTGTTDRAAAKALHSSFLAADGPLATSGLADPEQAGESPREPTRHELAPCHVVSHAADQIASPESYHRDYAAALIAEYDPRLLRAVREPYSARAVVLALTLDRHEATRARQRAILTERCPPPLAQLTFSLRELTAALPDRAYLPLIDLTLPALAAMSRTQYREFMPMFGAMVKADDHISLFEWTLGQVLLRHLRPKFEAVSKRPMRHQSLDQLGNEVAILLSTLAWVGHRLEQDADQALQAGAQHLGRRVPLIPQSTCTLTALDNAVKKLATTGIQQRGELIDACATIVCFDGSVEVREAELVRGIADLLDCPVPPLITLGQLPEHAR